MSANIVPQTYKINRAQREKVNRHQGKAVWFMGLSGSGKSTLANQLEIDLFNQGFKTYVLDGDNVRAGLNQNLTFSREDRKENLRRIAEVANLFVDAGFVVLASFITPYESDRRMIREIISKDDLLEVYVACSLEVCESRDVKGLYAKARKGEIKSFTGIDAPFEEPVNSDLVLNTDKLSEKESLNKLVSLAFNNIEHDLS